MHGPINVKSPNNITKWQMGFNSAFKGLISYSFLPTMCNISDKFIHSFIHSVVCLTTGPKPLPKPALHIVRSRASSFKWEYHLLSLGTSSSFLHLLPRLPVSSIPPFIFPSITHCRRQFLRKMWPIQFAFRLHIPCRIFLCSLTLSNIRGGTPKKPDFFISHVISPTDLFHPSPAPHFRQIL
jgi:hypothetical protein